MSKFNEGLFEKRARDFKSIDVGKDVNLKKEIEKLPTTKLKDLWTKRKFRQFLERFENIISDALQDRRKKYSIADCIRDKITPVLSLLPELGYSYDDEVHRLIFNCYKELWKLGGHLKHQVKHQSTKLRRRLARSFNKYVVNILHCTERMKIFFDDDIKKLLKSTSAKLVLNEIEDYEGDLRQVLYIIENSYIYPLDSDFPAHPGVYCIYHVGKRQLYEGSQVFPSARKPVYVGRSKNSIADRLKHHCKNVAKGKTATGNPLKQSDFVVRFIPVKIKDEAASIERMLIKYFSPVWNREAMKFCFGNASSKTNNWNRFHIQNKEETIEDMLEKLRIRSESLESICSTDEDSSDAS